MELNAALFSFQSAAWTYRSIAAPPLHHHGGTDTTIVMIDDDQETRGQRHICQAGVGGCTQAFSMDAEMKRKKLRIAAACVLSAVLVLLIVLDRRESSRASLRAQCEADAALGSRHVLAWQTAAGQQPLADTLKRHIDEPGQLGFSPVGRKMLQYLAAHTNQWAAFRSDDPEQYKPILRAACLSAN